MSKAANQSAQLFMLAIGHADDTAHDADTAGVRFIHRDCPNDQARTHAAGETPGAGLYLHGNRIATYVKAPNQCVLTGWAGGATVTTQRRLRALDKALRGAGWRRIASAEDAAFTLAEGRAGRHYEYFKGETMDQALKARWVAALRSGEYEQGHMRLRKGDRFCCLGVLADLVNPHGWFGEGERCWWKPGTAGLAPHATDVPAALVPYAAQGVLAALNDRAGLSFSAIADWIEENL